MLKQHGFLWRILIFQKIQKVDIWSICLRERHAWKTVTQVNAWKSYIDACNTINNTTILEHPFGRMLKTPTPSQHVKNEMDHYQPYNYLQIVYHEIGSSTKVITKLTSLESRVVETRRPKILVFITAVWDSCARMNKAILIFSGSRCSLDISAKTSRWRGNEGKLGILQMEISRSRPKNKKEGTSKSRSATLQPSFHQWVSN